LNFSIDRSNGHLHGTLVDAGATWSADVHAYRRTPNTSIGARQNFCLDPASSVLSSTAPSGASAGYALITGTTGATTVTMRMADGLAVTKATSLGQNGDIPLFAMLYANKGSIHGKLVVVDQLTPLYDTVTGTFTWNKTGPASTSDKVYAAGFDFGVNNSNTINALGSEYRKPTTPTILWGIGDVPIGQTNVKLSLVAASIETSAYYLAATTNIDKSFRLSTAHAVTMPLPNLALVTCAVNSTTGEVSGTMTLKDGLPAVARVVSYYGITTLSNSRCHGWFTLPQLPVTTTQAGSVEFWP
jgi:hypothetical protein